MSFERSNRPVLIGAAQFSQRDVRLDTMRDPLDMALQIARESAEAAGGAKPEELLSRLDAIALTSIIGWKARNAPRLIADALGARPTTEWVSNVGGESALAVTNAIAERIVRGESELAFVFGANNMKSLGLARAAGVEIDWPSGGAGEPTLVGKEGAGNDEYEESVGLGLPISVYPLFENALRVARGQSLEEHARAMGSLMAPFTEVAAANPHAWFPTARSAEELVTATPANRMIFFPYAKYLNAVIATEQAAGAILASEAMADRLGVPPERRVYWRGGAFAVEDPWLISERPNFHEAPAMATCHHTALANAGLDLGEIDRFDFYSCFPVAVAMACKSLDLAQDDPRGLTLTGGLPYAGGPGSSYPFHSLATAVERLQAGRDDTAMVTGNGWYLTKHSATLLAREPGDDAPSAAPREDSVQGWSTPPVTLDRAPQGDATVETYTIGHGRDGAPEQGIIVGRLDASGARFLAHTPADPTLLADLESRELIGTKGHVTTNEEASTFTPR